MTLTDNDTVHKHGYQRRVWESFLVGLWKKKDETHASVREEKGDKSKMIRQKHNCTHEDNFLHSALKNMCFFHFTLCKLPSYILCVFLKTEHRSCDMLLF